MQTAWKKNYTYTTYTLIVPNFRIFLLTFIFEIHWLTDKHEHVKNVKINETETHNHAKAVWIG